jgi:bifunctional pyridoxal-dependent enzyme with beta-cystathionase and maltose regulon repressor activities
VSNITSNSAELRWSVPEGMVSFLKIFGREKGTEKIVLKRRESTDTRAFVKDLSPNTTYEWGMRSVCDAGKSIVVQGPDFTTLLSTGRKNNITIFPNPVRNSIQIEGLTATQRTKLSIVDFLGNTRFVTTVTGASYNWNIATLQAGNYLLKIETNNTVTSLWFVKE